MAKKKTFTINGKSYVPADFTFNTICDLEDCGFSIDEMSTKTVKFLRAYFAVSSGLTTEEAGAEIEKHMIDGGSIEDLRSMMMDKIEESGFFQTLSKRAKESNPQSEE